VTTQQLEAYLRRIEEQLTSLTTIVKGMANAVIEVKNDNVHLNRDMSAVKAVLKLGEWKKQKKETGT